MNHPRTVPMRTCNVYEESKFVSMFCLYAFLHMCVSVKGKTQINQTDLKPFRHPGLLGQDPTKVDGSNCDESSCVVSCQPGWEREGDYCYFWSEEKKNWFEAEETCKRHGGHLASVTDQHIHDYMMKKPKKHWIGGFLGNEESNWMWTDCSEWTFDSGWKEGEPNFVDKEKCVEYRSTQHTVYFRPKKMSKSEEGSSVGAIFRSKWELLSKAHKVISGCGC